MELSIVVAMTRDLVIGREGKLPWHHPSDLRNFRQITWGKPIIMGRRTHESLGRPLPGRTNIILTRRADYSADGCLVAHSAEEAIALAESTGCKEAMIIGGREVYREFLPRCDTMYLTLIEGSFVGDTYFPENPLETPKWVIHYTDRWPADETHSVAAMYIILWRRIDDDDDRYID